MSQQAVAVAGAMLPTSRAKGSQGRAWQAGDVDVAAGRIRSGRGTWCGGERQLPRVEGGQQAAERLRADVRGRAGLLAPLEDDVRPREGGLGLVEEALLHALVQQQPGALQVAQEQVAEAGALGGAFDQTGQVGHHEALLGADAHDAQ